MNQFGAEVSSDDKLWAAIGYPIPILPLIVLLSEDKKNRPFLRYHAVQSIALNIALYVLMAVLTAVTLGFGGLCAPPALVGGSVACLRFLQR